MIAAQGVGHRQTRCEHARAFVELTKVGASPSGAAGKGSLPHSLELESLAAGIRHAWLRCDYNDGGSA